MRSFEMQREFDPSFNGAGLTLIGWTLASVSSWKSTNPFVVTNRIQPIKNDTGSCVLLFPTPTPEPPHVESLHECLHNGLIKSKTEVMNNTRGIHLGIRHNRTGPHSIQVSLIVRTNMVGVTAGLRIDLTLVPNYRSIPPFPVEFGRAAKVHEKVTPR